MSCPLESSAALKFQHEIFENDLVRYLIARLIPGALAILSLLLVIRTVSADQLGIYILVAAGVGLLQIFLVEWLKAFLVRTIASGSAKGSVVSQGFRYLRFVNISVVVLALVGVVLYVLLNAPLEISGWFLLSSSFLFIARARFELEIAVLNASLLAKEYLHARVSRNAVQLLFFWGLAEYGLGSANNFLIAQAISYALVSFFVNDKRVKSCLGEIGSAPITAEFIGRAMSFGLPVALSLSIGWIVSATDKMLIGKYLGLSFAGQYGAIAEIVTQIVTLCFVIPYMAFYPRIMSASQHAAGSVAPGELFRFHGNLVIIGALALGLMSTIFPQSLGAFVWGDELAAVVPDIVFPITLGLCFFGLKTFYIDIIFHVYERTDLILKTSSAVALINVFGNLLFIPLYGLQGAAWVTAISMGIGLGFSLVFSINTDATYFSGFSNKFILPIICIFSIYSISFFLDDFYRIFIVGSCACLFIAFSVYIQRRLIF